LRLSCSGRDELVWNPSKMKLFSQVSCEESWDMSLSKPWDVCIIFCIKEKDILKWARQPHESNQNWRAFSIVDYLRVLFSSAGNAFAISLRQKSEVPHRHAQFSIPSQFP
jgi:hypothetical protein